MVVDISGSNHQQLTDLGAASKCAWANCRLKTSLASRQGVAMITSEGLDYAELMGHKGRRRGAPRGKAKQKYCNPSGKSQTWSGRGRQPRWFAAVIKAGKTERSLPIK